MKLDIGSVYEELESSGSTGDSINYEIDASRAALIVKLLSQYKNALASIVREITSNAFDSHREAAAYRDLSIEELKAEGYESSVYKKFKSDGDEDAEEKWEEVLQNLKDMFSDWEETPVGVEVVSANPITGSSPLLLISDKGMGLSPYRVRNIFSKFLGTTKDQSNTQIGAFGLGSKSPLGYTDMFTVVTRWNGIKYQYMIRKGAQAPILEKISEEETDEPNGTTVEIAIKSTDGYRLKSEIQKQLAYFDNISYKGVDIPEDYEIYTGKHFAFRTNSPFTELHICLGKVYYPIDFYDVGISHIGAPIALYFSMEELDKLDIMWNRENVEYTDKTKEAIKEKLRLVKEELQGIWNKHYNQINSIDEYLEGYVRTTNNTVNITEDISINCRNLIRTQITYDKYKNLNTGFWDSFTYCHAIIENNGENIITNHRIPSIDSVIKYPKQYTAYLATGSLSAVKSDYIRSLHSGNIVVVKNIDNDAYIISLTKYVSEYKELAKEFIAEVHDYFIRKCLSYDDVEVPEDYSKEYYANRVTETVDTLEDVESTVSVKEIYWAGPYSGFKWHIHDRTPDWLSAKKTVVYGFAEDEDDLFLIAPLFFKHREIANVYYDDGSLNKHQVNILKIAKSKEKYIKENSLAIHVSDFKKSQHSLIRRAVTHKILNKSFNKDVSSFIDVIIKEKLPNLYKSANIINKYNNTYNRRGPEISEELLQTFIDLEGERIKRVEEAKANNNPLPKELPLLDSDILDHARNIMAHIEKYPLLPHINISNIPEEAMDDYIACKGHINPHLHLRLKEKRKENE